MEEKELIHIGDVSFNVYWKEVPSRYLSIKGLYVGKLKIASYCIDGCSRKGDKNIYSVSTSIPIIKSDLGRFETEEQCKKRCLQVAKLFCEQLQYKPE